MPDTDKLNKPTSTPPDDPDDLTVPVEKKGWIDTEDRISEILFGLIMALTFTCTISIAQSDNATVNEMLLRPWMQHAWGLIDAVLYVLMKNSSRTGLYHLNFVRRSKNTSKAPSLLPTLPPVITNVLQPDEMEKISQKYSSCLNQRHQEAKFKDYKIAVGIFCLAFYISGRSIYFYPVSNSIASQT
jgi:hypothetical protein